MERGDRILISIQPPSLAVAQAGSVTHNQHNEPVNVGEFLSG
jgi:hypothetical protein